MNKARFEQGFVEMLALFYCQTKFEKAYLALEEVSDSLLLHALCSLQQTLVLDLAEALVNFNLKASLLAEGSHFGKSFQALTSINIVLLHVLINIILLPIFILKLFVLIKMAVLDILLHQGLKLIPSHATWDSNILQNVSIFLVLPH